MSTVTAESQGHLLVFHLVDHLCISMLGTHKCELNTGAFSLYRLRPFHYIPRDDFSYRAIRDKPREGFLSRPAPALPGLAQAPPTRPPRCPAFRLRGDEGL